MIILVTFFLGIYSMTISGCQNEANSIPAESEWIELFDGSDIDSWRGYNMEEFPDDGWYIDGDELVFDPDRTDRRGLTIITRQTFRDFELRLEYNISEGGNSGIFHHAIEQPGHAIHWSAPEMQILDNEQATTDDGRVLSGSLYDLVAADPQNTRPAGEWNSIRIISTGPQIEYWQNGEKILEFERWTPEWYNLVRASKFECHPSFGNVPEGHIGLQDHRDLVRFRNIRIRNL